MNATTLTRRWTAACERLGVQPKHFAVLVGATVLAIGALVGRSAFTAGKRGSAPRAATATTATAGSAAATAPTAHVRPATTVRCALQSRPARDPFRTFVELPGAASGDGTVGMPLAAAPAGLVLRAVIAGELAVIGEHTVGIGGTVADSQGGEWTVESIRERAVVLSDGARRAQLGYVAAPRAARPSGTKSAAARGGAAR
ncbi:MAG: hypothetical protein ACKOV8_06825 [Phycisphaerales bacterium]